MSGRYAQYAGMVDDFKLYFTTTLPDLIRTGSSHTVDLSSLNWKNWTKNDLTSLATNKYAVDLFESLIIFKNGAVEKKDGKYTVDAIGAQNVLTDLAPNICNKNTGDNLEPWQRFFNLIEDVQRETAGKRPSKAPQPKYTPAAAQNTPASTQKTEAPNLPPAAAKMVKEFDIKFNAALPTLQMHFTAKAENGSISGRVSLQWSKEALEALAKSKDPKAIACFKYLLDLTDQCSGDDANAKQNAKAALAVVAKRAGMDIATFIGQISRYAQQNDYGGINNGTAEDVGIHLNRMDDPTFDQQAALDLFTKNAVVMNSEHSLKSPDPKAKALEAVKGIKIRIA